MGPLVAPKRDARQPPSLRAFRPFRCPVALSLAVFSGGACAAEGGCGSVKPGHPTAEERAAFVRGVSELAVKPEKEHGVRASASAAVAIAEAGYVWTRIAPEADNLFAWKFGASALKKGRAAYAPTRSRPRDSSTRCVAFEIRAAAFDHIAGKLATATVRI